MENECATLEKRITNSSSTLDCWKHFDKPVKVTYVPVSRPGWYDIGIDGGGDIDLVDYKILEKES